MSDWGPVLVAVVLFVVLTPGLFFQIPGPEKCIEFCSFETSTASILIHAVFYFALISVFVLGIGIHITLGS